MNNDTTTPTPRTDADERMAWNAEYMVPTETARELERELTAMTEQRDGLRSGIDYASDQLHKVTEQRDRMAVLLSDIYNYAKGKKPHDYSKLTESDRIIAAFDAWQEIESKIEELLQTTPNQTGTK